MSLTIAKKDLLPLIARCREVTERKSTMPLLSCVLLRTSGRAVEASASDMSISVHGSAPCEVSGSRLAVAVPAKELEDRIKMMPDGPLTLDVEGSTLRLRAAGKARRYTMHTTPADDFPALPEPPEEAPRVRAETAVLGGLIARVKGAVSTDDTRMHLASALLEWRGEIVTMVATDGHRLHLAEAKVDGSAAQLTLLIPRKGLAEIERLCGLAKEVDIVTAGTTAFFVTPGLTLSVKLTDATFPPYAQVIPKDAPKQQVDVPAATLTETVRAMAVAASSRTGGIALAFDGEMVRVTATSPESGEATDEVALNGSLRTPVKVGMNAGYLLDALAVVTAEGGADAVATMQVTAELEPVLVVCGAAKCVLMPMRVA